LKTWHKNLFWILDSNSDAHITEDEIWPHESDSEKGRDRDRLYTED